MTKLIIVIRDRNVITYFRNIVLITIIYTYKTNILRHCKFDQKEITRHPQKSNLWYNKNLFIYYTPIIQYSNNPRSFTGHILQSKPIQSRSNFSFPNNVVQFLISRMKKLLPLLQASNWIHLRSKVFFYPSLPFFVERVSPLWFA